VRDIRPRWRDRPSSVSDITPLPRSSKRLVVFSSPRPMSRARSAITPSRSHLKSCAVGAREAARSAFSICVTMLFLPATTDRRCSNSRLAFSKANAWSLILAFSAASSFSLRNCRAESNEDCRAALASSSALFSLRESLFSLSYSRSRCRNVSSSCDAFLASPCVSLPCAFAIASSASNNFFASS